MGRTRDSKVSSSIFCMKGHRLPMHLKSRCKATVATKKPYSKCQFGRLDSSGRQIVFLVGGYLALPKLDNNNKKHSRPNRWNDGGQADGWTGGRESRVEERERERETEKHRACIPLTQTLRTSTPPAAQRFAFHGWLFCRGALNNRKLLPLSINGLTIPQAAL